MTKAKRRYVPCRECGKKHNNPASSSICDDCGPKYALHSRIAKQEAVDFEVEEFESEDALVTLREKYNHIIDVLTNIKNDDYCAEMHSTAIDNILNVEENTNA